MPLSAEQAEKCLVIGQRAEGAKLQPVEGDVIRIEIDHIDRLRASGQVGQHVATAGADGDDAVTFAETHGVDIDLRILPDLRIDETGEEHPEQALRHAVRRKRLVLEKGGLQFHILAETGPFENFTHWLTPVVCASGR